MAEDAAGIDDEGILWQGTREELEAWKTYKSQKAARFVERGYSVEWYPDADNVMAVYVAERHRLNEPEIRASVKFYNQPSQFGIDGGKVSKLMIQRTKTDPIAAVLGRRSEHTEVLFNYDRGHDIDRLERDVDARQLYDAVIDELN